MIVRHFSHTDGRCYGLKGVNECEVLTEEAMIGIIYDKACCTYACPFYKPEGSRDWLRLDRGDGFIKMYPPEETRRTCRLKK